MSKNNVRIMAIVRFLNRCWVYDTYFSLCRPLASHFTPYREMEMGACISKSLSPNCPPRHHDVVPLWKLRAWWTTEFSPVYANPTSLNKEEEGRMVEDTDAGHGVSIKTPRGRKRETASLLFPS